MIIIKLPDGSMGTLTGPWYCTYEPGENLIIEMELFNGTPRMRYFKDFLPKKYFSIMSEIVEYSSVEADDLNHCVSINIVCVEEWNEIQSEGIDRSDSYGHEIKC